MKRCSGVSGAALALLLQVGAPAAASPADALVDRAEWQEEAFRTTGALIPEGAVTAYVADVARRVSLTDAPPIRVALLRNSDAFAFALSNGAVYLSVGLLTRMTSESELAAIIAREASLVVGAAGAELPTAGSKVDIQLVAIGPDAPLKSLIAPSTVLGMSDDIERIADAMTVRRLLAAGYDVSAAERIHDALARQSSGYETRRAFAYSNVARMNSRARGLAAAAMGGSSAGDAPDRYAAKLRELVVRACESFVRFGRPELAIAALADAGRADAFGSVGHRLLADAYRLRDEEGDDARARAEYELALRGEPPDPRAHLGIARLTAKLGDRSVAVARYDEYLRTAPSDAFERPMAAAERAILGRAQ